MIDSIYDPNDLGPARPGFSLGRTQGRAFKGGGGGSSNVTNTTKVEPPPQLAPYLAPFMQQASAVAMTPYQAYQGQQIADFTPDQKAGFDMARYEANRSQQYLSRGNDLLTNTIGGNYLGYTPGDVTAGKNAMLGQNNPYLQSAINSAHDDISRTFGNSVFNNTDATMARAGAFGGSAWQQAQSDNARQMSNELGRVSNDMRMADYGLQAQLGEADLARQLQASQFNAGLNDSAYQSERARQLQAAGMLPGMAQQGFANAQALLGIGDAQQAQNQGQLDIAYQNWMNQQNQPYQSLDVMGNAIRTLMGGGGTQTQTGPNPYQRSGTASALGGALGGGMMGMQLGGPMGGMVGAGLGLLGGIL